MKFAAIDSAGSSINSTEHRESPRPDREEFLRLTAKLEHWNEQLITRLVPNPPQLVGSLIGALTNAITQAFWDRFAGALATEDVSIIATSGYSTVGSPEPGPELLIEARVKWSQIENLEAEATAYLAELFDGRAALTLREHRRGKESSVKLSSGDLAAEPPIFGRRSPIYIQISLDDDSPSKLSFLPDSSAMRPILEAGSAEMRATPGGRKDLALLFLQGAIEEALVRHGNTEADCLLDDFTSAKTKTIEITLPKSSSKGSATQVARALREKWPGIFI